MVLPRIWRWRSSARRLRLGAVAGARHAGFGALLLGGLLALYCGPAAAQTRDIFTVRGVAVDASASSSAEARSVALAQGQNAAFAQLMRRLALAVDRDKLPVPTSAQLADLIGGFEITNEKVSSTRYRAILKVEFNSATFRLLLRGHGVRFAETLSKPVVLVPLFQTGSEVVLWAESNLWRVAWAERPIEDSLVPLIIPLGDLVDINGLNASLAAAPDRKALTALAERYGTTEVVVATVSVRGRLSLGSSGGEAGQTEPSEATETQGPTATITLRRLGTAGEQTAVEVVDGQPGETLNALLATAADRVVRRLEEGWKAANQLRFDRENVLRIVVPLRRLGDWIAMRGQLIELPIIVGLELNALSRRRAVVGLKYLGEAEQLALALEQVDLGLSFEAEGWFLRSIAPPADGAAPGQAQEGF